MSGLNLGMLDKSDAKPEDDQTPAKTAPAPAGFVDPTTGRKFDDELGYLRWKVGRDAQLAGEEKKALREELNTLRQRMDQAPQTADQMAQIRHALFSPDKLDNEQWSPVVNEIGSAFMKYDQLNTARQTQQMNALTQQLAELKSMVETVGVRATSGITPSDEQSLFEKVPGLQGAMDGLDETAKLPVLKAVKGVLDAQRALPGPNAAEHVEPSAPSEGIPDNSLNEERLSAFDGLSAHEQLSVINDVMKSAPDAGEDVFGTPDRAEDFTIEL